MICFECGSDDIIHLKLADRYHCNECGVVGTKEEFNIDFKETKKCKCTDCKCK